MRVYSHRSQTAPVAQLDRVIGFEPIGRGFESLQARHFTKTVFLMVTKLQVICEKNEKLLKFQLVPIEH